MGVEKKLVQNQCSCLIAAGLSEQTISLNCRVSTKMTRVLKACVVLWLAVVLVAVIKPQCGGPN